MRLYGRFLGCSGSKSPVCRGLSGDDQEDHSYDPLVQDHAFFPQHNKRAYLMYRPGRENLEEDRQEGAAGGL
jgi:hypothetical protein